MNHQQLEKILMTISFVSISRTDTGLCLRYVEG
jgi:hypothetical protein